MISLKEISVIACYYMCLPEEELVNIAPSSLKRGEEYEICRKLIAYFARKYTFVNNEKIAVYLGYKDRNCVYRALRTFDSLMSSVRYFRNNVEAIDKELQVVSHTRLEYLKDKIKELQII